MSYKKGDYFYYVAGGNTYADAPVICANVLHAHRNGDITIRALFYQRNGEDVGSYLGYKFRLSADEVHNAKLGIAKKALGL